MRGAAPALVLVPILALGATFPPGGGPEAPAGSASGVAVYTDGTVALLAPGGECTRDGALAVSHCWVWTAGSPPVRIESAATATAVRLPETASLELAVTGPQLGRPAALRALAAPAAMWMEVPEALLPSYPLAADGRARLPVDPAQSVRIRVLGAGWGSGWSDVDPARGTAAVRLYGAPDRAIRIESADDAPCTAASALALSADGSRFLARFAADEDGSIEIPAAPGEPPLQWVFTAHDCAPVVLPSGAGLPERLPMPRGGTLSGRVVDPAARPLPAARIEIEGWLAQDLLWPATRSVTAADDGSWSVGGLAPGAVALRASAPGHVPLGRRAEMGAGTLSLGAIVLHRGVPLGVRVVDDRGSPVASAEVEAGEALRAASDRAGVARLEAVPADLPLRLTVAAPGHLPAEIDVASPLPAEVRARLIRAFTIRGRLVAPDLQPVEAGVASIARGRETRRRPLAPGGLFEIALEPGSPAELVLTSASTAEARLELEAGEPGDLRDLGDVVAPRALAVTGRLVDALDGTPVAGARIWATRTSSGGPLASWLLQGLLETQSDADGAFRLGGLSAGPGVVRIDAAGFARRFQPIFPEPDQWLLDLGLLEMTEGATVEVLLEGAGEREIAWLDPLGQGLPFDSVSASFVDGRATLAGVSRGSATVWARRGDAVVCEREVEVPESGSRIEVECPSPPRIEGEVWVGDAPAGAGSLLWLPEETSSVPSVIIDHRTPTGLTRQRSFQAGRRQVTVEVDDAGGFATRDLAAGSWRVIWVPALGSAAEPQRVVVPEIAEWRARLDYPGTVVRGLVTDSEGSPVARAWVEELRAGGETFTDESGRFALATSPPGPHRFRARRDGRTSPAVEIDPEHAGEGREVHLVLGPDPTMEVRLRVVDSAGLPAAGALAFVELDDGRLRMLATDADGRAAAAVDSEPSWFRASVNAGGTWGFESPRPWVRDGDDLRIALGPTGSLRLVATADADGGRLAVTAPGGWELTSLLRRLGVAAAAGTGAPLDLHGLPAGSYQVAWGAARKDVEVRAGEVTELLLD